MEANLLRCRPRTFAARGGSDPQRFMVARAGFLAGLSGDSRVLRARQQWIERVLGDPKFPGDEGNHDQVVIEILQEWLVQEAIHLVESELGLKWGWLVDDLLLAFVNEVMIRQPGAGPIGVFMEWPRGELGTAPADPVATEALLESARALMESASRHAEGNLEQAMRLYEAAKRCVGTMSPKRGRGRPRRATPDLAVWAWWFYRTRVKRNWRDGKPDSIYQIAKEYRFSTTGVRRVEKTTNAKGVTVQSVAAYGKYIRDRVNEAEQTLSSPHEHV